MANRLPVAGSDYVLKENTENRAATEKVSG